MASVLMAPPRAQYSRRAALRQPEVAAFANHARAQLARVDAHAIVGAIADIGILLARRLDVGADAAVVEQIDLRGQDVADHFLAARRLVVDAEQRRAPRGSSRDGLRGAIEDPAAAR